ncbi:hypothetical protein POM88_045188 [Heracleum sosnowskyi]|uniref:Helitron helicase-like domain-containing protein n=1 Tax=Heracleum sosnowskyi TaxID=360622 RepID=A0AAD8H5A4_9APIA|nr:hypothetical protein POM88_045188 [Heracleum sosnowskyi]
MDQDGAANRSWHLFTSEEMIHEESIIDGASFSDDGLFHSDDSYEEGCSSTSFGPQLDTDSDSENDDCRSSPLCKKIGRRSQHVIPEEYASLGTPSVKCVHCNARMWKEERVNKNVTRGTPIFSICCKKGDVKLPSTPPAPSCLMEIYNDGTRSAAFQKNIRIYNSMFSFTSTGGNIDHSINRGIGPYIYRLNGQNHHIFGSLIPDLVDLKVELKISISDSGRKNHIAPSDEVAAVMVGSSSSTTPDREDGYHDKITKQSADLNDLKDRDMISMKDYYSYRFQIQENEAMTPRLGGRLFQQNVILVHVMELCTLWSFKKEAFSQEVLHEHYLMTVVFRCHDTTTVKVTGRRKKTHNSTNDEPIDEIEAYFDGRYICGSKAAYRIYGFPIHHRTLSVNRSPFHLPGQKNCTFQANQSLGKVAEREKDKLSKLEAFFLLNKIDRNARQYTYDQIPKFYVWNDGERRWNPRKRGYQIGRLSYTHHSSGEVWYLRMLLTKVVGPTSFKHLRTVNGVCYGTFRDACKEYGLLDDDKEWHHVLDECAVGGLPPQIRQLFVHIIVN